MRVHLLENKQEIAAGLDVVDISKRPQPWQQTRGKCIFLFLLS